MRPIVRRAIRLGLAIAIVSGPAWAAATTTCHAAIEGPFGKVAVTHEDIGFLALPPARAIRWTPPKNAPVELQLASDGKLATLDDAVAAAAREATALVDRALAEGKNGPVCRIHGPYLPQLAGY